MRWKMILRYETFTMGDCLESMFIQHLFGLFMVTRWILWKATTKHTQKNKWKDDKETLLFFGACEWIYEPHIFIWMFIVVWICVCGFYGLFINRGKIRGWNSSRIRKTCNFLRDFFHNLIYFLKAARKNTTEVAFIQWSFA